MSLTTPYKNTWGWLAVCVKCVWLYIYFFKITIISLSHPVPSCTFFSLLPHFNEALLPALSKIMTVFITKDGKYVKMVLQWGSSLCKSLSIVYGFVSEGGIASDVKSLKNCWYKRWCWCLEFVHTPLHLINKAQGFMNFGGLRGKYYQFSNTLSTLNLKACEHVIREWIQASLWEGKLLQRKDWLVLLFAAV